MINYKYVYKYHCHSKTLPQANPKPNSEAGNTRPKRGHWSVDPPFHPLWTLDTVKSGRQDKWYYYREPLLSINQILQYTITSYSGHSTARHMEWIAFDENSWILQELIVLFWITHLYTAIIPTNLGRVENGWTNLFRRRVPARSNRRMGCTAFVRSWYGIFSVTEERRTI